MRRFLFIILCCVSVVHIFAQDNKAEKDGDNYYDHNDYDKAAEMYSMCMETNDDCFYKFMRLLLDKKIEPDYPSYLFEKISPRADAGDPRAEYFMGKMFLTGNSVSKDYEKAIEWFDKAIEDGYAYIRRTAIEERKRAQTLLREESKNNNRDNNGGDGGDNNGYNGGDDYKGSILIMPGVSFGSPTSFSIMAGYVKSFGGYLKFKSSFTSKNNSATVGTASDGFFNNGEYKGRTSFYGGLLMRFSKPVYMYAGVGYGNKWLQMKTLDNNIVNIDDGSFSGVDPELGIIIKVNAFSFGGGINCLIGGGQTSVEANLSVGVMF